MADNVALPAEAVTAATDEIGGVHYQRIKPGFGADGTYTDVTPANGLPVAAGYLELTGGPVSANNTNIIADTDVRAYRWISLQLTGTFNANIQLQASNNGTTWFAVPMMTTSVWNSGSASGYTRDLASALLYSGFLSSKYIRLRTTGYTSGSVSAIAVLSQEPGFPPPYLAANSDGVASIAYAAGSTSLVDDDLTSQWHGKVGAGLMIYDGTNMDRVRNVTAADGQGSAGVIAAGLIGFDATASVNRRLRSDNLGQLRVIDGYAELTGSASAVNTAAIAATDVSGYRWCSIQLTGSFSGLVHLQGSNNNTTWVDLPVHNAEGNDTWPRTYVASGAIWSSPLQFRYIRLITAAAGFSGTVNAVMELFSTPPVYATPRTAQNSGVTSVAASTSSVSLLTTLPGRRHATFYNDATGNLYLRLGGGSASTTTFTVKVAPGGYYESPADFAGSASGIWDVTGGAVRVTEIY